MNYSLTCDTFDYKYNTLNTIYEFFVIFNVLSSGLLMGFYFVAIFVYKPMYSNCLNEPFDCQYPPIPFEDLYPLKDYDSIMENIPNKNSFVLEYTPFGNIIMKYDYDVEGFIYWGNKNVTYNQLNTIARKYVNMFVCK